MCIYFSLLYALLSDDVCSGSSFESFEYNDNKIWMKFTSGESKENWGFRFDVRVSKYYILNNCIIFV